MEPAIGLKKKHVPPFQPMECETKTNRAMVNRIFPRFRRSCVFALSSHWLIVTFTFVLIGSCNCFGFGVTTLS